MTVVITRQAGRREWISLAVLTLPCLRAASQAQVAAAFGVDPGTIWRWDQALAAGGVAGLVPSRRGPKGASKLTPEMVERIRDLDAAGATLREIAAATGVSTFSVRNALGRVPSARQHAAAGRRVTVCFDRGGWSPALFADLTAAGFGLLTWRMGPAPDLPAETFTTVACTDDRGRAHQCELADTTVTLGISDGPRKGQTVTLRQVTRRVPAKGGGTRQMHALTSRTDLPAGEVCWRMTSRWREGRGGHPGPGPPRRAIPGHGPARG